MPGGSVGPGGVDEVTEMPPSTDIVNVQSGL